MAHREIYTGLKVDQIKDPIVATADANSDSVDMQDYDSLLLIAGFGASGDTLSSSVKVEAEVQESDDDSTFTAVADADLINYVAGTNDGTFAVVDAAAEDEQAYATGYRGSKRYVRVVFNFTGTHTNGIEIAAYAIRGHARSKPVNEPT